MVKLLDIQTFQKEVKQNDFVQEGGLGMIPSQLEAIHA
jgi:hypothetical protein